MSGIELQHNGMRVIKEVEKRNNSIHTNYGRNANNKVGEVNVVFEHYNKFSLVKAYEIAEIRKNSPAALAGLKEGDIIVSINGNVVDRLSLSKVTGMLQGRENKRMRLKVIRGKSVLKFEFRLKEVL